MTKSKTREGQYQPLVDAYSGKGPVKLEQVASHVWVFYPRNIETVLSFPLGVKSPKSFLGVLVWD